MSCRAGNLCSIIGTLIIDYSTAQDAALETLQRPSLNSRRPRLQNLMIEALQRVGGPTPRIPLDGKLPCRLADARPQIGIGQQAVHCVGKRLRVILDEEVPIGHSLDPLGTERS